MHDLEKNEEIVIKVEKLLNTGLGLGKFEGFPIFIKNVCPEDIVKVKIKKVNKNFAEAELLEILEASPYRVKPFCALQKICGGCQLQFISYEKQLKEKTNIVKETIHNISGLDVEIKDIIPSPQNKFYRHKTQMPTKQTKNSKRFLIGYYQENTHELINIKHCPIHSEYTDKIVDFIRTTAFKLGITAYDEYKHKGELRHIVIRSGAFENNYLVILVINSQKISQKIKDLATKISEEFSDIVGVCVNVNTKRTNTILSNKTECIIGQNFYTEKLNKITYKIHANSFFQVNPYSAINILETVKNIIKDRIKQPTILDAYCGVGCFGLYLNDIAKSVCAVEECKAAIENAKENAIINNANNFEFFAGDAQNIFETFRNEKKFFDVIILDPPRKGCTEKALDNVIMLANSYIIYVSCNPATLARDIKYLDEKGFKTIFIQPVDMFCHTYHIENIALIKKL